MEQKMDQNKTDQILELLAKMNANQAESMARMEANKAESKAERKADKEEMKATIRSGQEEMIKAITGVSRKSTEACEEMTKALPETTEACPEVTHACLEEEKESTPKETDAVEEPQEFPEGVTDEEKFGATKDRAGELRLAVRRHRQRKKRAQENSGPRQKFAAFRRWFTRRAVPALLKGHVRKGSRRNRRSGVREPRKTFRSRIDGRSLIQWQIKGNVARRTPEGRTDEKRRRTRPECNSGIRRLSKTLGNGMRRWTRELDRRLKERILNEAIRKSPRQEIVRLIFESSIGLREPGDGLLWKCRPPPKRKR
jgi:hypothetical protein